MEGKKILITGGAGSIGSVLTEKLAAKNDVYIIDSNETAFFDLHEELRNEGTPIHGWIGDIRFRDVFEEIHPDAKFDYIFHAAALKHVTPSSWTPMEYVKTNIHGTHNVLDYAWKTGATMVNVSTDKVVNSNSIMGATKRVAEIMVKNAGQISVRFGNVMGSRGSVIPIWQKQLDENRPLTVTDPKMTRYMMTIPQACDLIIKAAEIGEGGEIFILKMGEPVNVLKLAEDILQKSGKDLGIKMIGSRPGETLDEKLYTDEEAKSLTEVDNFLVLK